MIIKNKIILFIQIKYFGPNFPNFTSSLAIFFRSKPMKIPKNAIIGIKNSSILFRSKIYVIICWVSI